MTFTPPGGSAVVVDRHTENVRGIGEDTPLATDLAWGDKGDRSLTYDRNEVGTWWFQVSACLVDFDYTDEPVGQEPDIRDSCPSSSLEKGDAVGYTHGAWTAPVNFDATSVPGGIALTWTSEKDDYGLVEYQYSMDDGEKWKPAGTSGAKVVSDVKPGEHTFILRALSRSDNSTSTARTNTATALRLPVLPRPRWSPCQCRRRHSLRSRRCSSRCSSWAAGAYLLRRRQSGGLTARVEDWLARRRSSAFGTGVHQHLLRTDGHHRDRPSADLFRCVVRGRVR